MKRYLTETTRLLVVLGTLLSTQSFLLVQIAFDLRQEALVEAFCVNKDNPDLDCNGSCFLSDMHAHEQQSHQEQHTKLALEYIFSLQLGHPSSQALAYAPVRAAQSFSPVTPANSGRSATLDIFQPPEERPSIVLA
jgi:hypothetical protein